MAVDRVPVLKRCRSLGLDPIYLGIDKKSNRESKRANKKISEYGLQLREKQKAKFIYGVLEKPFRNYYAKASKMNGMVGTNLMILLECRLDNVLFRMGLGRTRKEARQIVDHKHVLVNGKLVNIPSYQVKAGDVIEIKEKFKSAQRYKDILEVTAGRMVPAWIEADQENLRGTVKELPNRDEIEALTGRKIECTNDAINEIRYFHNEGIEFVVISLGEEGSIVGFNNKIYKVTVPKVNAINPVGSGDSYVAGVAIGLARNYNINDVLKLASACGTANAMEKETGSVRKEIVDELIDKIRIEVLE